MRSAGRLGIAFRAVLAGIAMVAGLSALRGTGRPALQPARLQVAPRLLAVPRQHAPRHPGPRFSTSLNWSGYAVYNKTNVVDVKGSWIVPTANSSSCSSTYSATWVGIDGYNDNTVEQLGTEQDYSSSGASYYAWFEMYPHPGYYITLPNNGNVRPGDTMNAQVQYIGHSRFTLSMSNLTRGWNFSTTQKLNAQRSSAEWIMEAPYSGGILPLTNFGTLSFSGCQATIGSTTNPLFSWSPLDPMQMVDSGGSPETTTPAGSGSSFSISWANCH